MIARMRARVCAGQRPATAVRSTSSTTAESRLKPTWSRIDCERSPVRTARIAGRSPRAGAAAPSGAPCSGRAGARRRTRPTRSRPPRPAMVRRSSARSSRPRNSSSSTTGANSATPSTTRTTSGPWRAARASRPPAARSSCPADLLEQRHEPERDDLEQHPGGQPGPVPGPDDQAEVRAQRPAALDPAHDDQGGEDRPVLGEEPDRPGRCRPGRGRVRPAPERDDDRDRRSAPTTRPANQTQTTSPSPQRSARRVGLGAALTGELRHAGTAETLRVGRRESSGVSGVVA